MMPEENNIYRVHVIRDGNEWVERVREDAVVIFVDNVSTNHPDVCCVAKLEYLCQPLPEDFFMGVLEESREE